MLIAALALVTSMANANSVCRIHISTKLLDRVNVEEFLARNYRVEISGAGNIKDYLNGIGEGDYGIIATDTDWMTGAMTGQIVQKSNGAIVPVAPFANNYWKRVHNFLPDCVPN